MIVRVPDYFSEFSCIAGECKDSCCLGWEIDIDEDSYEYYQTLPGEVGERLRKGNRFMEAIFTSFLVSVIAGVVSYYICNWLDGRR